MYWIAGDQIAWALQLPGSHYCFLAPSSEDSYIWDQGQK